MAKKTKKKLDDLDLFAGLVTAVKGLKSIVVKTSERLNQIEPHIHDHNITIHCPICQAEIKVDVPLVKLIKPTE